MDNAATASYEGGFGIKKKVFGGINYTVEEVGKGFPGPSWCSCSRVSGGSP